MQIDSDAVLWSAPERERAGRPLLVLMHGYLSHEGDLFGLSPLMPLGPVIASLRRPDRRGDRVRLVPARVRGRPRRTRPRWRTPRRAPCSTGSTRCGPPRSGLLGFSQGGAMALQLHAAGAGALRLRRATLRFRCCPATRPATPHWRRAPPAGVLGPRAPHDALIPPRAHRRTDAGCPGTRRRPRTSTRMSPTRSRRGASDVGAFLRAPR